jgi:putative hydrolase of the HAD superfamily
VAVILFDFFGTLVDYDPSRTAQGYQQTHAQLAAIGADLGYQAFLAQWDVTAARFDAASDEDDHEFSMTELTTAFLADTLGRPPTREQVESIVASYLAEWNQGVRPIEGVPALLASLAARHRLAVVTNTHSPTLVPSHLAAMGVADCFEAVITSVDVGWRKPHRAIYDAALTALADEPASCTFVGDTRGPDYIGPRSMGMRALLIDPEERHAIPSGDRLASVLELPGRL